MHKDESNADVKPLKVNLNGDSHIQQQQIFHQGPFIQPQFPQAHAGPQHIQYPAEQQFVFPQGDIERPLTPRSPRGLARRSSNNNDAVEAGQAKPIFSNERVPIPAANRNRETTNGAKETAPSGPMSSTVTLPSRPKPGRKPIPKEESVDRRREQNRMSQRAFRDKRQQKLVDIQDELKRVNSEHKIDLAEAARKYEDLRINTVGLQNRNNELERELQELKQQLRQLKDVVGQGGNGTSLTAAGLRNNPMLNPRQSNGMAPMVRTPPIEALEMDFTTTGRDASNTCGFCTTDENCHCKQSSMDAAQTLQDLSSAPRRTR